MITLDLGDQPGRTDEQHSEPIQVPTPLTPGSHAAALLHRMWSTPPEWVILVRRPRWAESLSVALEHLHLRCDMAVIIRAAAPKYTAEIAGAVLAPDGVREVRWQRDAGYILTFGSDIMFDIEVDVTSPKSATVRRYATPRTDVPLDVILAARS